MIPKILHMVWVGGNKIPQTELNFMENNKKILHDYEINLWNDDNIESLIKNHPLESYVRYALAVKRYAHANDGIKTIALQKFGGWSIDADNKILKPLDIFRHHNWVSGFELYVNKKQFPITAAWGALPNHKFTQMIIDEYLKYKNEELVRMTNTSLISKILINRGKIVNNNSKQYSEDLDVTIYPYWTFCTPEKNQESYIIHNFSASWH